MRTTCKLHGRYTAGCTGCAAHSAHYRRTRVAGLRDGSWERVVTGEQLEAVRTHVRSLLALPGVSAPLLAGIAGVTSNTIYRITKGKVTQLGPQIAQALLEVTAQACAARVKLPAQDVPSVGVMRRLRALAADGWNSNALADLSGYTTNRLGHLRAGVNPTVRVDTHERIRELYEKIQSLADPSGGCHLTAQRARRYGYLLPERWADEDIDNPDAQPLPPPPETEDHVAVTRLIEDCLHYPAAGRGADLPREVKKELARHARNRLGWSWEQLAWLLGYKGASTAQYLVEGRPDRPARKHKEKQPWPDCS